METGGDHKGEINDNGKKMPGSCKPIPTKVGPLIDMNKCEGREECVKVCPYDVFEMHLLSGQEKSESNPARTMENRSNGNRKAYTANIESCHACGVCVTACPEKAITLIFRN